MQVRRSARGRDARMATDVQVDRLTTENGGSATIVDDELSTIRADNETRSLVAFVPSVDGQHNVPNLRSTDSDCTVASRAVGTAPITDREYRRSRWRETERRIDRIPVVRTECADAFLFPWARRLSP